MSYYHTCVLCGAHLDPCERCTDCESAPAAATTGAQAMENTRSHTQYKDTTVEGFYEQQK